ncbi:lactonase family protein [Marinilongibacter aquaticus]|uniref:lactonase family protein n=1 Tax=Marinilongibacter aquaticus TaxID=2975157 RepID=UPI0021BDBBC8|nr:lactonase family protein [Marinilongibacter aquaticus]UBM57995.1 lactonase family protein [Marinilongibacter aquaticus]
MKKNKIKGLALGLSLLAMYGCTPSGNKEETESETKTETEEVKDIELFVGTYTKRDSKGIYRFTFNPETAETSLVSVTEGIEDPSFLALSPDQKYLYSVSELKTGSVFAYSIGDSSLTEIDNALSGGVHPCHVAVDKTGKWVIAANYSSGSLAVLPVLENGGVGEAVQVIQHEGHGPDKGRQAGPHVHSVNIAPNNKDVFVCDLGIDKIMAYRLDEATGQLTEGNSVDVKPGSGPRHFAFHPNGEYAYLIQEMGNLVTAYKYSDGKLEEIQEVNTLPEGFEERSACADIHISNDGKFLYGSNRFHDSIVIFAIDPETGELNLVSHHSVMGQVPRNFALTPDNKYLLVANQESDDIIVFSRDADTGKITPTGQKIAVSMPVCLIFRK